MTAKVALVSPEHYAVIWPHIRGHVEKSCKVFGDKDTPEWFEQRLFAGEVVPFIAVNEKKKIIAACLAEIVQYANGRRVCYIVAMGGHERHEWQDAGLKAVEEYARAHDCDSFEFQGRMGWLKTIPREYKKQSVLLTKRLK